MTDVSNLSGLFKEAYGDSVENLVPASAKIQKAVDFIEADKEEGNFFNQPVIVQQEQGFTYAAAGSGAFSVNSAVAMQTQNAKVQGSNLLLESVLSYDAAAKASGGKKAFMRATELLIENMVDTFTKRLEIMFLYGQSANGLGLAASSANVNATTTAVTFVTAQFAAGIWAGSKGTKLDLFQTNGSTKINTNAALVVSIVDIDNLKITITGNSTDIAAVDTYIAANPNLAIFYYFGANSAGTFQECAGLDKIVTNAGTLFNIDASVYPDTWKGVSHSIGSAALTFGKLIRGLSKNVNRGLNQDVTVYLSPLTWTNLNDDLAALRRLDSSFKSNQLETGSEAIKYYSINGVITVEPHIYVKQGEAFSMPVKRMMRPGATDVTFKTPGLGDQIFFHDPSVAGFRYRAYSLQAIMSVSPAWMLKATSIVNS